MSDSDTDAVISLGNKSEMGVVQRTDGDVSLENLNDVEEEVSTAEDFIVYGRASVENYDDDTISQKIEMEAFEESLDQFFAQGAPISYQHKDVTVGKGLREYELDSNVAVSIGDESYEFEAGDTLETRVEGDTLWLVAHIYGRNEDAGSDASVMTRLGAYKGDLDGFSVTIKNKAYRNTPEGQVIEELDFHSVTVGTGDQIKNKDALFGVAEFKLDDIGNAFKLDIRNMEWNILKKLRSESTEAMSEEVISHAITESQDLAVSAKAVTDGEGADEVLEKATARLTEIQEKSEDREDLVSYLADLTGKSTDEVNDALDTLLDTDDDVEQEAEHEGMDDNDESEDEDDEGEMEAEKAGEVDPDMVADLADAMDVPVDDLMSVLESMGEEADEMEDDEMDVEQEAEADEAEDEVETEAKSDDETDEVDSDDEAEVETKAMTEDEVEALVEEKMDDAMESIGEKLDEMESEVAEAVSERITEKLETGSTPEQDNTPADDGSRNLLDDW